MSNSPAKIPEFSTRILQWYDQFGRKDLPWQQNINPYRVWVSEIMLQQTQVKTVIPYFQRFMDNFSTVTSLAEAEQDQVLHLWTGLGYYARARNLHKAAKIVCEEMDESFPSDVEALCTLPGIGRSTAGAIRSIAFGQPAAILDGNVKRVLARYEAIGGWPGQSHVLKQLWSTAENLAPATRVAHYSQAMMDLGATLCTRSAPQCELCPLGENCKARASEEQLSYPGKKPRKALPVKSATFLMLSATNGDIWLERRPNSGIWGGLWCFPELPDAMSAEEWCLDRWGILATNTEAWHVFRHTFSHYHLDIQPLHISLPAVPESIMEAERSLWYNRRLAPQIGLATPVARLLDEMARRPPNMET